MSESYWKAEAERLEKELADARIRLDTADIYQEAYEKALEGRRLNEERLMAQLLQDTPMAAAARAWCDAEDSDPAGDHYDLCCAMIELAAEQRRTMKREHIALIVENSPEVEYDLRNEAEQLKADLTELWDTLASTKRFEPGHPHNNAQAKAMIEELILWLNEAQEEIDSLEDDLAFANDENSRLLGELVVAREEANEQKRRAEKAT